MKVITVVTYFDKGGKAGKEDKGEIEKILRKK